MGIQSIIGDVSSAIGNNVQGFLDGAWSAVHGIADNIGSFVANIWSGGFAGVSNYDQLKSAVSSYSNDVKSIVDNYNMDADLEQTFKGEAGTTLKEFVTATKSLLDAYVALVEKWNTELDTYYEKYQGGDTSLSQNVSSDAQQVEQAAQNVNIG